MCTNLPRENSKVGWDNVLQDYWQRPNCCLDLRETLWSLPYEKNLYPVIPTSEANFTHENPYFIRSRQLLGVYERCFLNPKGELISLSLSLSHSQIRVCGCELRGVYDPHYKQISSLVYFFSFFIFFIFNIATRRRAREGSKNSKATWRKRWFTNHPPKSSSLCNIVTQLLGLLPVSMSFKEFLDHPIPSQCVLHGCGIHI